MTCAIGELEHWGKRAASNFKDALAFERVTL